MVWWCCENKEPENPFSGYAGVCLPPDFSFYSIVTADDRAKRLFYSMVSADDKAKRFFCLIVSATAGGKPFVSASDGISGSRKQINDLPGADGCGVIFKKKSTGSDEATSNLNLLLCGSADCSGGERKELAAGASEG